jgi:hypothetical protein
MSDDALTDDERAQLESRYARLSALMGRPHREQHWRPNKRYAIELEVPDADIPVAGGGNSSNAWAVNTDFAFREGQALVEHGKVFLCEEIEVVYSVAGTSVSTGIPATFVIAAPRRSRVVDFYLKFRDTGSDRDWQNDWVPGNFFQSANLGGFILGDEAHAVVSGGSSVFASLQVAKNNSAGLLITGLENIISHKFMVSLIGCQIPLEGA